MTRTSMQKVVPEYMDGAKRRIVNAAIEVIAEKDLIS